MVAAKATRVKLDERILEIVKFREILLSTRARGLAVAKSAVSKWGTHAEKRHK